jgi:tripartite-type tricarboxylate transporter receptor subunit TctC
VSDIVGFLAPLQTPASIIRSLNQNIVAIGQHPDFSKRLADLGLEAFVSTPLQYTDLIRTNSQIFGKLINDLNIAVE